MHRIPLKIIDFVTALITVAAALALGCAFVSGWVDPNGAWWIAFFGLVAPVIILINILLAAYWIFRWKPIAFLPLAVLLLGLGKIGRHIQLPVTQERTPDPEDIRVLTYNVHVFEREDWKDDTAEVLGFVKGQKPDIICFQEFSQNGRHPIDKINDMLAEYPYRHIVYNIRYANTRIGLAIYSRYKIVRRQTIDFEDSFNGAIWADVADGRDTLRVFNCHMQTSKLKKEDIEFLTAEDPYRETSDALQFRNIMQRLKVNNGVRARQADSVAVRIAESPYPVILCGDFNDTPLSYTYTTLRGGLKDAFVEKGKGYGYTFRNFKRLLRIDFVLHDKSLEATRYFSPDTLRSDHNPVIVDLKMKKQPK